MMKRLASLLREKSETLNLFSAGDRLKLEEKHLPDSVAVLPFWGNVSGQRVLDLGTGGGLPGLALAASCGDATFYLMDAREKKVRAVLEVAEELGLKNVKVAWGRFEVLAHEAAYRGQFDIVVARAVASLPVLLEYAAGFLKGGGSLYAWKGPEYESERAAAAKAERVLGLSFKHVWDYVLPGGEQRFILQFVKEGALAESYPRRDGVPREKPL